nr:HDOD domain-containing protein [Pseudomonas sp. 21LCFQ010]
MTPELTPEQIQQALQGISVPAQPQILVDLQMEQYMPDPDLGTIAKLISHDPGLSGALLKIVNSAHFGLTNKIASIDRAVNLLGSRTVINLINAQSIKGEMSDETIVTLNRFWDTAQDVAMTSLTLSKRIGSQTVDESYALGLFHDCGVPLMLKRFPDYMQVLENAYANANESHRVVDTENAAFDTNHAVVGYYTARSWRLPEHLCAAIANHHNALAIFQDESSRNAPLKNLLGPLKMAEHICQSFQVLGNQEADHEWEVVGPLVLDYVGLSEYDFEYLKESIRELSGH